MDTLSPTSPLISLRSKRFFMVRHGETVSNASRRASGALDTPLTDLGREQAKRLAPLIERLLPQPRMIVHSHLSRARETAALLNVAMSLPMTEREALGEQSFGDWVGQPWECVKNWMSEGRDPPNGEACCDFRNRAVLGLADACSLSDAVLIVTHGGVFHALAAHFGCVCPSIRNCELYEFVPHAESDMFPWKMARIFLDDAGNAIREAASVFSQTK